MIPRKQKLSVRDRLVILSTYFVHTSIGSPSSSATFRSFSSFLYCKSNRIVQTRNSCCRPCFQRQIHIYFPKNKILNSSMRNGVSRAMTSGVFRWRHINANIMMQISTPKGRLRVAYTNKRRAYTDILVPTSGYMYPMSTKYTLYCKFNIG